MNASYINFTKCDIKNAKNLSLDGKPIVPHCYRVTNPKDYLSDSLIQKDYSLIRRGDVVYERTMFENPYFSPLFTDSSEPVFFVETSPQLVSRIATFNSNNFMPITSIEQINNEALNRYALFTDIFQQLNSNTYSKNRESPVC
jgi:hypothetical protein